MKVFNKWDPAEAEVADLSIKGYMNLQPRAVMHSGGKHARQQFRKSDMHVVERLINKMMRKEKNTGQKQTAYRIVEGAFDIIHERTKENPLTILARAISNSGPREEVVRLKYGGITVPKAVDTAPQRRVDSALMLLSQGAWKASFKSKRSIQSCLADEIIAASNADPKSFAVNKRDSAERVAKAAR
ncbi:MAG: 30S ribosomal protein S7 [Methanosaeta sp. PtaB.Bin039]|nr:MAG: 30S ribosomal protein S7 [Methanosaeta sp. PtaB.Bin039]OPY44116.1 MAG: 30S ribosomal protein S7 [Methanosaeta sp. PtaU1.Bin028]HOT06067.1 30S ribosomal protein S7 [Methanotrichaceae archaeon]HQF16283.1 30S ribosomal protein S7 [Methanotrichaceae archaeon]HQI90055.1 30S ribosomal protein S7 [Methanotrichaceae archaeon]